MVLEFAFHSGYVTPEGTAQGRNGRSKQPCGFLPSVAGVAHRQNRTTSFAEQPHNLFKLQAGVNLAAPSPVDCPVGEFARPTDGFEPLELGRAAIESPPESKHQETIYLA